MPRCGYGPGLPGASGRSGRSGVGEGAAGAGMVGYEVMDMYRDGYGSMYEGDADGIMR